MSTNCEKLRTPPVRQRSECVTSGPHSFLRASIGCVARVFTHSQVCSRLGALLKMSQTLIIVTL